MKQFFLLDESLSPNLAIKLRQLGYIVKLVKAIELKGSEDIKIIEWAIKNKAVIITGDLDFGELWYWHYYGKVGIIVIRVKSYKVESQYKVLKFLHDKNILANEKVRNSLIISTYNRYRIRTK